MVLRPAQAGGIRVILAVKRETLTPCCAGTMEVDGEFFGYTLERPWLNNQRRISAIPASEYTVTVRFSPRFRRAMLALEAVPARTGILIHGANHWSELAGCLAVAEKRTSPETIQGNLTAVLKQRVDKARASGEVVKIIIQNCWEVSA